MLILIPGATGNIGTHLVRAALRCGHQVRALGRSPAKLPSDLRKQLESFVQIQDLDDKAGLDARCTGADAVIVAYNGDPNLVLDAHLALLRAAERANIKRYHAMSWILDWENMAVGTVDSYDPFIASYRQAKQTSHIKPVYVFSGVLAMTLFGLPGAGALEGSSALWVKGENGERTLKVIGRGETKTPWSAEPDVAEFSVALIKSNEAPMGGFYRYCSDKFTLKELASTYRNVRNSKCSIDYVMDLDQCKQILARSKKEAQEAGEVHLRWKSYLGLSYAICIEEGTYNPQPVDTSRFPDVPRTTLAKFIEMIGYDRVLKESFP